jgi:hypothetical protein
MEEEDFSTFVFHHSPDLTFLLFDALVTGHFKAVTLAPHLMTLRLAEPFEPTLPLPNPAITPRPHTLSNKALIAEGVVKLERGVTKEAVWMPVEKMVSYVPLKSTLDGSRTRRFLMRNSPGGPVVERLEDWSRWELPGSQKEVYEGLYIHLQVRKLVSHFNVLQVCTYKAYVCFLLFALRSPHRWRRRSVRSRSSPIVRRRSVTQADDN